MLSIKTNLSNQRAQYNLKTNTTQLNQAVERLSSGYKLNHASDNAANYSISTNMSTKLGAYQVAEENAMQGLEMMTTTSAMLSQIEDKLLRMRVLAVQTLNGTNGTKSMTAIDSEAQSLYDEIVRINESATYNGIKLFNTGMEEVTNAGKELEVNEQGFLLDVVRRDTSTMVSVESINETQTLAVGTYSVSSVEDLLKLHNMSKAGLLEAGSEFVLAKDIDLKEYCKAEEANGGWTPIKLSSATLDGNGYTISNLYINRPSSKGQSFLATGVSAVKNLKLENVDITADSNVGAFVGGYVGSWVGSYVNCSATGKIVAKQYVGAIVGAGYYSDITSCYADMDITGTDNVGGLYGFANYSTCKSSYFKGSVTGNNNVGGIVGRGYGTISNCKVVAAICGNNGVGGICSNSPVSNSYFSGSIIGNDKVGGISGTGTVNNCIVEGSVNGVTNVGIFSGGTSVTVKDCYYYGKNLRDMSITADDSLSTISNIIDITIPCDYVLQVGTESDSGTSLMEYTTYIEFSGLKTLLSQGISDKSAIEKIDGLLNVVSLKQTEIGAVENRLYSVLEELDVKYDNLLASRSTICDTDVAEVSSTYIKQQILQNAGATLMSTSQNVNANMVLGLLQGLNG